MVAKLIIREFRRIIYPVGCIRLQRFQLFFRSGYIGIIIRRGLRATHKSQSGNSYYTGGYQAANGGFCRNFHDFLSLLFKSDEIYYHAIAILSRNIFCRKKKAPGQCSVLWNISSCCKKLCAWRLILPIAKPPHRQKPLPTCRPFPKRQAPEKRLLRPAQK